MPWQEKRQQAPLAAHCWRDGESFFGTVPRPFRSCKIKCRLRRERSPEKQVRQDSEHIDRCAARTQASGKIVWTGPPHAGMLHARKKRGAEISPRRIVQLSA